MTLYEERSFTGAALPQALLKWDTPPEEQPPITDQENIGIYDLLVSDSSFKAGLTNLTELWLEQQFDLSLFDSIASDVQYSADNAEDILSISDNSSMEQSFDDQLTLMITNLPRHDILPLQDASLISYDNSTHLENGAQELMDTITEQDFLSDTCSSISVESADSDRLPLSPCSYGSTVSSTPPLTPPSEQAGWNESCTPPLTPPSEQADSYVSSDPLDPCSSFSDDPNDVDYDPTMAPSPTLKFNKHLTPYSRIDIRGNTKIVMPQIKITPKKLKMKTADRKQRKMVQNKNAATKYRIKKRSESEELSDEFQTVNTRNKELHESVDQMTREIKYLKDLIKEVNRAKGVDVVFI